MEPRICQLEQEIRAQHEGMQLMSESLQTTVGRVATLENALNVEIQERHQHASAQDQMPAWAVEFQQVMQGLKEEVAAVGQQLASSHELKGPMLIPEVTTEQPSLGGGEGSSSSRQSLPERQAVRSAERGEPDLLGRTLVMVLVTWVVMMWFPMLSKSVQGHQLHALQCEPEEGNKMVAFSLPVQCKSKNRDGADEFVYSAEAVHKGVYSTTSAYILQKNEEYQLKGQQCSKRISTDTAHCGMFSYESPETSDDRIYERVPMSGVECEEAMRGLYTDAIGRVHHVAAQGVTYISFMSLGELVRDGETVSCRGEDAVINGRRLTGVVQRTHLEIEILAVEALVSRRTGDVFLPSIQTHVAADKWNKKGFGQVSDKLVWLPLYQTPPCPFEIAKGPVTFLEIPALNGDENSTVLVHAPSKLRLDLGIEEAPGETCGGLLDKRDQIFQTNYRQLFLLRRNGDVNEQHSLQLLTTQINEVDPELVEKTQNDFLSYVLRDALKALRGEVEEGGCLTNLAQTYALRHRRARGNLKIVVRNDLVYLLPCRAVVVTALEKSAGGICSDQMTVQDEHGEVWQLSPVDRLLVHSIRQVPCASTKALGYAYRTVDQIYVTQNPNLTVISPPSDPDTMDQASRLWNEYQDAALLGPLNNDSGPYSAAVIEKYEGAFLREWTVASRPVQITHDAGHLPAIHANAARHQQFLAEAAAATGGGIGGWLEGLKGGLLSVLETGALTLILHLGSVAGLILAVERILISLCHGAKVLRSNSEERGDRRCQVGWAAVCCPIPLLMWALLSGGKQDEGDDDVGEDEGSGYPMAAMNQVANREVSQTTSRAQLTQLYRQAAGQLERGGS